MTKNSRNLPVEGIDRCKNHPATFISTEEMLDQRHILNVRKIKLLAGDSRSNTDTRLVLLTIEAIINW
ncbi:MAG: hypothetical protein ACFFD4_29850 [Candidatus Odinarchaeota archaeon]